MVSNELAAGRVRVGATVAVAWGHTDTFTQRERRRLMKHFKTVSVQPAIITLPTGSPLPSADGKDKPGK